MSDKEVIANCDICGKDIHENDTIYTTTNNDEILTTACEACGSICSEAISMVTPTGIKYPEQDAAEKLYADCRWSIADIHERRADNDQPEWTDEQAHAFLEEHEDELSEAMCETGWGLIEIGLEGK